MTQAQQDAVEAAKVKFFAAGIDFAAKQKDASAKTAAHNAALASLRGGFPDSQVGALQSILRFATAVPGSAMAEIQNVFNAAAKDEADTLAAMIVAISVSNEAKAAFSQAQTDLNNAELLAMQTDAVEAV